MSLQMRLIMTKHTWILACSSLSIILVITCDKAFSTSTAEKEGFVPASVHAQPELQCRLHSKGSASSTGLPVSTDDDGFARFHAVKLATADPNHELTLDCTNAAG